MGRSIDELLDEIFRSDQEMVIGGSRNFERFSVSLIQVLGGCVIIPRTLVIHLLRRTRDE